MKLFSDIAIFNSKIDKYYLINQCLEFTRIVMFYIFVFRELYKKY
jgi:hypothetical protein